MMYLKHKLKPITDILLLIRTSQTVTHFICCNSFVPQALGVQIFRSHINTCVLRLIPLKLYILLKHCSTAALFILFVPHYYFLSYLNVNFLYLKIIAQPLPFFVRNLYYSLLVVYCHQECMQMSVACPY